MRAKRIVVLVFTFLWCIVLIVRARLAAGSNQQLDASWLMSLASTFEQGSVSGRDFHFTYGPLAQLIASAAMSLTASGSAFDAYPAMIFTLCLCSALLIGAAVLLADEIDWRGAVFVYLGCAYFNLFHEAAGIRLALLLVTVLVSYRAALAPGPSYALSISAGCLAIATQLMTLEVGIYAAVAVSGVFLFRILLGSWTEDGEALVRRRVVERFGLFWGVFILGNVALALFYRTTGDTVGFFDYHRYSLEMMRGYNNGMGAAWGFDRNATLVFLLAAIATTVATLVAIVRGPLRRSVFLFSLLLLAFLTAKSSLVRSDIGHIAYAFTPLAFLMLVLCTLLLGFRRGTTIVGGAALISLFALSTVWPWSHLGAANDLLMAMRGSVSLREVVGDLYSAKADPAVVLSPALTDVMAEPADRPILVFPYENYVAVLLERPLIAPVLQSYNAGTVALQEHYVKRLEENLSTNFDTVFSNNAWPIDGIHIVTRTPKIFEFLYSRFDLTRELGETGFYLLQKRARERTPDRTRLATIAETSGEIVLSAPTSCGIPAFEVEMSFSPLTFLTKPAGLSVTFWLDEHEVATRYAVPIETNRPFHTFVSLIDDSEFYRVFGNERIESDRWNRLTYTPFAHDKTTIMPKAVTVRSLACFEAPRWYDDGYPAPLATLEFKSDPELGL